MRNQRRSHSLERVNQAQTVDLDSQQNPSLVSTHNLTQILQTAINRPSSGSSSTDSTGAPPLERSPPVSRRTTSRPTRPPSPPPRPPPYTSSIYDRLELSSNQLNHATNTLYTGQRLETLFRGLIPDPTNTRPRRSPLQFQPARTVNINIELIDDVKKLVIQASELHQDIKVKLTRLQLMLLRQEFERQDQTEHF
jgi:hypothetical protein